MKYLICALLDDLIAHETPISMENWQRYALRFYFFQETHKNDDRVFDLIKRLQEAPAQNILLLEFSITILMYGYQGNYRNLPNSYYELLSKSDELYEILKRHQNPFRKSLFLY